MANTMYADFTRRYSALVIDMPIVATAAFALDYLFSKIGFDPGWTLLPYVLFRIFIILQIPGFLYFTLLLAFQGGQTIGMRAMNIQVVDGQYRPIGPIRAIVRFYSEMITSVFGWLNYFSMMNHPQRQAWSDRLSGTYVVLTNLNKPSMLPLIGSYALNALLFAVMWLLVMTTKVTLYTVADYTRTPIWSWASRNEKFEIKLGAKENWNMGNTYLTRAQSLDPGEAKYNEKYILLVQSAREEFKKARDIDPQNPRIHAALGLAFSRLPNKPAKENAYESYKTALELDPQNPLYVLNVGVSAYNAGKSDEAYSYLTQAIQMNADNATAYYTLGLIDQERKQYDLARTHYEKAIELYSKNNAKGQNDVNIETARTRISELP